MRKQIQRSYQCRVLIVCVQRKCCVCVYVAVAPASATVALGAVLYLSEKTILFEVIHLEIVIL